MKKYYALITLSNKNSESKNLVEGQENIQLLCSWSENILNDFVSDTTNTLCVKPLTELVTGEKIYPETEDDMFRLFLPGYLQYDVYPQSHMITEEEAKRLLQKLKSNEQELKEYINYIYTMKKLVKAEKKADVIKKIKR